MAKYTKSFYNGTKKNNGDSAKVIVPMIIEIVHPTSVVEVGVQQEHG